MADIDHTTITSRLARNADGSLADLPRDLAHGLNHELMQAVALLQCCWKEIPELSIDEEGDQDDMHDSSTRAKALCSSAETTLRKVIRSMAPYV